MLKLLILFIFALIISVIFLWLGENSGNVVINWLGYKISLSSNFFLAAVIILIFTVLLFITILSAIKNLPLVFKKNFFKRTEENNFKILEKGILSLLSSDNEEAKNNYNKIKNSLPVNNEKYNNLFYAFEAKLNQNEGNYLIAKNSYEKLAENKNTRFFAVKGLLEIASLSGDLSKAATHAEEAYKIKPDFKDGAHSLLELYKNSGEIDKAFNFINKYKNRFRFKKDHNNQIDTDKEISELWIRKVKKLESYDENNQLKRIFIFDLIIKSLKYNPQNIEAINYLFIYADKLKEYSKLKKYYRIFWSYQQNYELTKQYLMILTKNHEKKKKIVEAELNKLQKIKNNIDIITKIKNEF